MCPVPLHTIGDVDCRPYRWRLGHTAYLGVVSKAAFRLVPGSLASPIAPPPIHVAEHGNPLHGGVEPPDILPHRPRADVLARGRAFGYGHDNRSVRLLVRRAQDVLLDKRLEVRAPSAKPIELTWTATHAGDENPLGVHGSAVVIDPRRPGAPASFQPISRLARYRRVLAGSGAPPSTREGWLDVPEAFDWRYFQTAPVDQQIAHLRGDETVTVEGMHPEYRSLTTTLPQLTGFVFVADVRSGRWNSLPVVADLLLICPEELTVKITWRGARPVANDDDFQYLRVIAALARDPAEVALVPPAEVTGRAKDNGELIPMTTMSLDHQEHAQAAAAAYFVHPFSSTGATEPASGPPRTVIPGTPWDQPLTPHRIVAEPSEPAMLMTDLPAAVDLPDVVPAEPEVEAPSALEVEAPEAAVEAPPVRIFAADTPDPQALAPVTPKPPPAPRQPARAPVPDVAAILYGSFS